MIYYLEHGHDSSLFENASCAMGVFDGLHVGHQYLLGCARRSAEECGGKSIALTFSIDPDELFAPHALKKLSSNEERIALLERSGVDAVAVLPFDREFAALSPVDFLAWTFGTNSPNSIHVGRGFRFGAKAKGSAELMRVWGEQRGTVVVEHELIARDGLPVSATRIRGLLSKGDVAAAERLSGRTLRKPIFLKAV